MKEYIRPMLEITSIFADENIAVIPLYDESEEDGSSVYIKGNPWELWD